MKIEKQKLYIPKECVIVKDEFMNYEPQIHYSEKLHLTHLTEDLTQIQFVKLGIVVDLGWYGDITTKNGQFVIYVIKDSNWNEPVRKVSSKFQREITKEFNKLVKEVENLREKFKYKINAIQFVEKLAKFAPDREELASKGYLPTQIEMSLKAFIIPKKENDSKIHDNPIIDLQNRYDTSKLIIGYIGFYEKSVENILGNECFANLEGNEIAINHLGKIVEINHEEVNMINEIANSAEDFLEGLLEYVRYLFLRRNELEYNVDEIVKSCVAKCGGGEDFFNSLIN